MKTLTSPVARATAEGKRTRYLAGYVVGVTFCRSEALLTKDGVIESMRHDAPKAKQSHCWTDRAQAMAVAKRRREIFPTEEIYVRAYSYETAFRCDLPLLETAQPLEHV